MASGRRFCLKAPEAVGVVLPGVQLATGAGLCGLVDRADNPQGVRVGLAFVGCAVGEGEQWSLPPFGFVKAFLLASVELL